MTTTTAAMMMMMMMNKDYKVEKGGYKSVFECQWKNDICSFCLHASLFGCALQWVVNQKNFYKSWGNFTMNSDKEVKLLSLM